MFDLYEIIHLANKLHIDTDFDGNDPKLTEINLLNYLLFF